MAKNNKKSKPTTKTAPASKSTPAASTVLPCVISFRISNAQAKQLKTAFDRDAATGINSTKQLARKIVCDYLAGRIVYTNPADKLQDFNLIG